MEPLPTVFIRFRAWQPASMRMWDRKISDRKMGMGRSGCAPCAQAASLHLPVQNLPVPHSSQFLCEPPCPPCPPWLRAALEQQKRTEPERYIFNRVHPRFLICIAPALESEKCRRGCAHGNDERQTGLATAIRNCSISRAILNASPEFTREASDWFPAAHSSCALCVLRAIHHEQKPRRRHSP